MADWWSGPGYRAVVVDSRLVPAVLRWFDENGRDLPWRHTREPWGILISELMSQQTQVGRVAERWPRFLLRFPSPTACADAPVGDVIDEWSGLGYNRRAVNLHRSAVTMRDQHGGEVPRSLADLLALPGIGPYTARAVRVFAFETGDGVLDTNVARILARTNGRSLKPAEAQELADTNVPQGDGWRWNQALLDLGATVCARRPNCGTCPLVTGCRWFAAGCPEPDPSRGSAGTSGSQSTFVGSDREGRGRLVRALRGSSIEMSSVAETMGWPHDQPRASRVLETLLSDGLVARDGDRLSLPR